MITPTRFGLKFAPVPTLALEYEVDELSASIADGGGGATSLYVYDHSSTLRAAGDAVPRRVKKLHVVELPALTKESEVALVARQLQNDNRRFLAPDVVKEDQLVRLLERLLAHAQPSELRASPLPITRTGDDGSTQDEPRRHVRGGDEDASDAELEESAMDESIAEASASMDASNDLDASTDGGGSSALRVATAGGDGGGGDAAAAVRTTPESGLEDSNRASESHLAPTASALAQDKAHASDDDDDADEAEAEKREAEADAAKLAALKQSDDASDGEDAVSEDDIQSEELEYFSEDGSDEDSF